MQQHDEVMIVQQLKLTSNKIKGDYFWDVTTHLHRINVIEKFGRRIQFNLITYN